MSTSINDHSGRAYGRSRATSDETLVLCGPGTPGGELLRRYWQPIALSTEATNRPKLMKVMDEELILFRTAMGEAGLLYPRCAHRGTSLLYGKVEDHGIRCCYHGWKFDPKGRCLDMPCEPKSNFKEKVRQPWYPVVEKFGLVFAYLGPADKQPDFPTFSLEEGLGSDEKLEAHLLTSGPNGPHPKIAARTDYNWWQIYDNFIDPFHVVITHYSINGPQFSENMGILPEVKFEFTNDGVRAIAHRRLPDGTIHQRVSQLVLPNMQCNPGVADDDLFRSGIGWIVPCDDRSFRFFRLFRTSDKMNQLNNYSSVGMLQDDWGPAHGKPFAQWSLEDHQDWQTDYITQKGQGDIHLHSEEHLSRIDMGIVMIRRRFKENAVLVSQGKNPVGSQPGVAYHVRICAGNALLDSDTMECIAGYDGRKHAE